MSKQAAGGAPLGNTNAVGSPGGAGDSKDTAEKRQKLKQLLLDHAIDIMETGSHTAKMEMQKIYGRSAMPKEHTGEDGGPIKVEIIDYADSDATP